MTTTKEIAELMNGAEYPVRNINSISRLAKDAGIVIVYGASDDLMEFEGAIFDEIGCCNGGIAYLTSDGLLENDCGNDDCPYFRMNKKSAATINAVWCPDSERSWAYETDIPHETFNVMEDGEIYCTGIVFKLSDVRAK